MLLLVAAIIALVLAAIELIRSHGNSLICWAVVVLAIGLILSSVDIGRL